MTAERSRGNRHSTKYADGCNGEAVNSIRDGRMVDHNNYFSVIILRYNGVRSVYLGPTASLAVSVNRERKLIVQFNAATR